MQIILTFLSFGVRWESLIIQVRLAYDWENKIKLLVRKQPTSLWSRLKVEHQRQTLQLCCSKLLFNTHRSYLASWGQQQYQMDWQCHCNLFYWMQLQHCSIFREKCLPCPCSKQDRWKSVWPRSHVAPGTLCLTECALQLKSASAVPRRGNLASDPNCTGHDCFGSTLKHSGEENDLQKSITAKAGDRPGKA